MTSKLNIFFDEKGPTKTIGIIENVDSKDRFNYETSDNIPAYCGIYVILKADKQTEFNKRYVQIENEYRKKNKQIREIKGANLFKKINTIQDVNSRSASFLISLLNLLKEMGAQIQLSAFDKSSVVVATRLKEWLFSLENNKALSHKLSSIREVLYTIVKYMRQEDESKKFLLALNDKEKTTYQILRVLEKGLLQFIEKNKGIPRVELQVRSYQGLIKIIRLSTKSTNDSGRKFKFPVDHLPFGLNLFVLASGKNPENCIIYLDEDAPTDGYNDQGFVQIKTELDSKSFPGLRTADILSVLMGKLLSSFDLQMMHDHLQMEKRKLLPQTFFNSLTAQKKEIAVMLSQLLFDSPNQYAIVHSEFADYVFSMIAWFNLASKDDSSFNSEKHLSETLVLMQKQFDEMAITTDRLNEIGFKNSRDAIEQGILKPFY